MLTDRLPPNTRLVFARIVDVLMGLIALFVMYYGGDRVLFFMETKQSLPDFPSLQVYWTYLPLPLGSLATLLFIIESVLFGSQHRRPIVMIGSHSTEPEPAAHK